ncbi:MAG: hypothetical protein Fur0043_04580 [Anaerolineales bacterium]
MRLFSISISIILLVLLAVACTAPQAASSQVPSAPQAEMFTSIETPSAMPAAIVGPLVEEPALLSLHMLDEWNGWGLSAGAVLRTNDGGATWHDVLPQKKGVTEFGYSAGTAFLSATQAWVLIPDAADPLGNGTLYRSRDGGQQWEALPVPFGSADVVFLDENDGWAMAGLGVGAGSMGVAIYRTADGGQTWEQVYTNDPNLANASTDLPLSGIKNDLTPLDTHTAWVSGVIYAPETFYFFKTSDGGRTWAEQPLQQPPATLGAEISIDAGPTFLSAQDGVLTVRFSGESYKTAFYTTHDGGQTWELLSTLPGAGAVDFVSPQAGVFWTGEQFFVTADGGQSWTSVTPDVLFGETFAGMDFVNSSTGWVWTYELTGRLGLYQTHDGGHTWSASGQ